MQRNEDLNSSRISFLPFQRSVTSMQEEPTAYGELISIGGINPSNNKQLSAAISEILQSKLKIPPSRFYIKFYDVAVRVLPWSGNLYMVPWRCLAASSLTFGVVHSRKGVHDHAELVAFSCTLGCTDRCSPKASVQGVHGEIHACRPRKLYAGVCRLEGWTYSKCTAWTEAEVNL